MHLLPSPLVLFLGIIATHLPSTAAFCYDIHGTELTKRPDIVPCNSIQGTVSMCCRTNVTATDADTCMPNGLCRQTGSEPLYWRDDCSSPLWPSSGCTNVCSGNSSALDASSNIRMTPCDGTPTSTKWCCGLTTSCCDTSDVVILAAVIGVTTTSSTHTTSTQSPTLTTTTGTSSTPTTATTSPTSSPTSSGSSNAGTSSGLSGGAKAGVGIGAGAIALLIVGVVIYCLRRKGKKSNANGMANGNGHGLSHEMPLPAYSDYTPNQNSAVQPQGSWKFWSAPKGNEMPVAAYAAQPETHMAQVHRQELDGTARRGELE